MTVFAWVWVRSKPLSQRKPAIIKLVLTAAVLVVLFLAVTGRSNILIFLLVFLFPLLRRALPDLLAGRMPSFGSGGAQAKPGNQSHVSSAVIDMTLDHDSGDMTGEILQGPMAGQVLADLDESEFIVLLQYCRDQDEDSARLLETYLDRRFGDSWRTDDPAGEDSGGGSEYSGSGGPLTESEALDILGLEPGASREEIIQAHRRLMQKMHPDRGGSNYLAARVNEAKERLLS